MKDPLKQGLKHFLNKTQINITKQVEVKDPLKQGLKQIVHKASWVIQRVEVKDPLKQGLKRPSCHLQALSPKLLK